MESDVKERVIYSMKMLNIKAYAIAKFYGLSDRTVNDQINGNSKIGVATIEALLAYRPDISAEWILRGTGSMLLTDDNREINIDNTNFGHHNNTNIGGSQTVMSGSAMPEMSKEQAMAALIKQNEQLLKYLQKK